ncbi:MAG: hypothetical protein ACXABY_09205 [Candidatus Thorarchaeota archaeon]|jgi:hypothetical protein
MILTAQEVRELLSYFETIDYLNRGSEIPPGVDKIRKKLESYEESLSQDSPKYRGYIMRSSKLAEYLAEDEDYDIEHPPERDLDS